MGVSVYPQPLKDYLTEVNLGNVGGVTVMSAMGERYSMGTTTTGEDIWRGTATSVPIPAGIGVEMLVVSSSADDQFVAGTGVQTLHVDYLDSNGAQQQEIIEMDGITPVAMTASDIRFVNDMYAATVGTNGVAAGNITIYLLGSPTTIYNMIVLGGNKSLVPHRMVPLGKTLILKSWQATEAQGKRVAIRIRSTDMNGVFIPGVFCFKGTAFIKNTATGDLPLNIHIPALSIIKVSGWPVILGAETSCSWWGLLIDD